MCTLRIDTRFFREYVYLKYVNKENQRGLILLQIKIKYLETDKTFIQYCWLIKIFDFYINVGTIFIFKCN